MRNRWTVSRFAVALCAVLAIGVALRTLALMQSPLPFNPDGLLHARNAERAVQHGRLPLSIMATDDLVFGSFLAVTQALTGVTALYISQPLIAAIGTFPALVAAAVASRASRRLGFTPSRARFAGLFAAAMLAIEGLFLYRSMPVDEQTPGLSLVPIAVLGAVCGLWTDDRRWFLAVLPVLAVLPPLHNLEGVVLGLSLLVLVGLVAVEPVQRRTRIGVALVIGFGFWAYFIVYTIGLARLTPAWITQTGRLTAAPGLFLAWIVLALCATAFVARFRQRSQRLLLTLLFLAMFVIIGVNAVIPVFPGMPATTRGVLLPSLGLLVPIVAAIWGYPLVAQAGENRSLLVALVAGPLIIVGFSLSASLTPEYLSTSVRTQWFLHVPILALAAISTAIVFRTRFQNQQAVRGLVVVCLLVAVGISIPVAFGGLSVHPYEGVTTTGELGASSFAQSHVTGQWVSDNHQVRITGYYDRDSTGTEAPLYDWLHNPGAAPPDCPVVTKESWLRDGAQFFPRPPKAISEDRFRSFKRRSHRIYDGGSAQNLHVLVPESTSREQCQVQDSV